MFEIHGFGFFMLGALGLGFQIRAPNFEDRACVSNQHIQSKSLHFG